MESNDASDRLDDLHGLSSATAAESLAGRPWAPVLLAAATVLMFSSYELDSSWVRSAAPVAWGAFVILWLRWLRGDNRARGYRRAAGSWKKEAPLLVALFVIASAITAIGAAVSWVLAGVLLACMGAGASAVTGWMARR